MIAEIFDEFFCEFERTSVFDLLQVCDI